MIGTSAKDHINALEASLSELEDIFKTDTLDAAMEAETAPATTKAITKSTTKSATKAVTTTPATTPADSSSTDKEKSEAVKKKADKKIEITSNILDRLIGFIQRILDSLGSAFGKVDVLDEKFTEALKDARRRSKPYPNIKIVNYEYTSDILEKTYVKYVDTIKRLLGEAISTADPEAFITKYDEDFKLFIKTVVGSDNDTSDTTIFYNKLRDTFRGKKSEQTILDSRVTHYENVLNNYRKSADDAKTQMAAFKDEISKLKTSINSKMEQARNASVNSESYDSKVLDGYSKILKTVAKITTHHIHFIQYMDTLKAERAVNAAIILKKFFAIKI